MGSGSSVQPSKHSDGTQSYKEKRINSLPITPNERRVGKAAVEMWFKPKSFLTWMKTVPFFKSPGVMHLTAEFKKKYKDTDELTVPIMRLYEWFSEWDDVHFFELVRIVDPLLIKSDVLMIGEQEEKEKKAVEEKIPSKLHKRVLLKTEDDFKRVLRFCLLSREAEKVARDEKSQLQCVPSRRFGGQSLEDLKQELDTMKEFPSTQEELKQNASKMVQRLSESYVETLRLQDALHLNNMEHENQIVEMKHEMEKVLQTQLRGLDEKYKKESREKDSKLQKIVGKYSRMKMKYKKAKTKNKFLHHNGGLGLYARSRSSSMDIKAVSMDSKDTSGWKLDMANKLKKKDQEIVNLKEEIRSFKKGTGSGSKTAEMKGKSPMESLVDGEESIELIIQRMDNNTDVESVKEALHELVASRKDLQHALREEHRKAEELEEKCQSLEKNSKTNERQLLRDNTTMMRQIMKLKNALQNLQSSGGEGLGSTADSKSKNEELEQTLKDADRIARQMTRSRKHLKVVGENPEMDDLKGTLKWRESQVKFIAQTVAHNKLKSHFAIKWIKNVLGKGKKSVPGIPLDFGTLLANQAGATTSRKAKAINKNMASLVEKSKKEVKEMLLQVDGKECNEALTPNGISVHGLSEEEKKKLEEEMKRLADEKKDLQEKLADLEREMKARKIAEGENVEQQNKMIEEHKRLLKAESDLQETVKGLADEKEGLNKQLTEAKTSMEEKAAAFIEQLDAAQKSMNEVSKQLQEREAKLEDELNIERKKFNKLNKEYKSEVKNLQEEFQKKMDEKDSQLENAIVEAERTYKEERLLRIKYHNIIEDMKGKIRVYCRIRPMSGTETKRGDTLSTVADDKFTVVVRRVVRKKKSKKTFNFDEIFTPKSSQADVYQHTANLVQSAYDGYNVCVFAYGQTGTGKTYTMYGSEANPGIAPRAIETLFDCVSKGKKNFRTTVSCYMVELYKASLQDLLSDDKKKKLKIQKNAHGIVEVLGSEIRKAHSAKDLMEILNEGNKKRVTSSTKMNAGSSRSHLILSILVASTNRQSGKTTVGKLSLVDLAGCERAAKTGANAQQLKEAQSINQSLSALGNVIAALSTGSKHVPYRSHILTTLMSDSLGGNAKTLMFVNVSPADYNAEETINALNYASRVKLVKNSAEKQTHSKVNFDIGSFFFKRIAV
ncbi:hypothetical protein AAMO2058_000783700 [Amorphochlora amoebiformis]